MTPEQLIDRIGRLLAKRLQQVLAGLGCGLEPR